MDVTIYSTTHCPWCKKTKEFLTEHKVKFKNIDVTTDTKAAKEMVEKTGQTGVPVVIVGDTIMIGFDEKALRKTLKIK